MTDVEERAIATLKEILTIRQNIENRYAIGRNGVLEKLSAYLDPSLDRDEWPALINIDKLDRIDKVEELPDGRVSVAYIMKPDKAPWYRAMFVKQDDGRLLLQSGMMLCPACFGDGKDDDGGPCILCDGEGWEQ